MNNIYRYNLQFKTSQQHFQSVYKNRGKAEKHEKKEEKDLLFSEQERKLTNLFLNKLDL